MTRKAVSRILYGRSSTSTSFCKKHKFHRLTMYTTNEQHSEYINRRFPRSISTSKEVLGHILFLSCPIGLSGCSKQATKLHKISRNDKASASANQMILIYNTQERRLTLRIDFFLKFSDFETMKISHVHLQTLRRKHYNIRIKISNIRRHITLFPQEINSLLRSAFKSIKSTCII